jgi:hypothetical protein
MIVSFLNILKVLPIAVERDVSPLRFDLVVVFVVSLDAVLDIVVLQLLLVVIFAWRACSQI